MTDEEINSKFDIVADHLAALAINQQKADERMTRIENVGLRIANAQVETNEHVNNIDRKIEALVDAQIRTEESVRQASDNVSNLTAVVDKYFSEGRNSG